MHKIAIYLDQGDCRCDDRHGQAEAAIVEARSWLDHAPVAAGHAV